MLRESLRLAQKMTFFLLQRTSTQASLLLPLAFAVVKQKQMYSLLGPRHTDLPS